MCDRTFALFFEKNDKISRFITAFSVLECPISVLERLFSVLERPFLF
jgi:hypothetical protein